VTVHCNPACDFTSAPSYRKYGFETSVIGEFREGVPITWTFYLDDTAFDIENYFLSVPTHENTLRAAGFRDARWQGPLLSPEGEAAYGRDYWSTLLGHPPVTFIECWKEG
jgi:toxoflavin synthase